MFSRFSTSYYLNLLGDKLEESINNLDSLFIEYLYSSGLENEIFSVLNHIIGTTKIKPIDLVNIIDRPNYEANSVKKILIIEYLIKEYSIDVCDICNKKTLSNIYMIEMLLSNRLDPNIITPDILSKNIIHIYKKNLFASGTLMNVLKTISENNPVYLSDYFSIKKNCDVVICYFLNMPHDYNHLLFLFFIENGLNIYKNELDKHIHTMEKCDYDREFSINPQFAIDLLKMYRLKPDIFHDDAEDHILYMALKFSGKETLQYIIDSDISSIEIKSALNVYNNNVLSDHIRSIMNKYGDNLTDHLKSM